MANGVGLQGIPGIPFNMNIKKLSPDGSLEFFDDSMMMSALQGAGGGNVPLNTGQPVVGKAPTAQQPQQGGNSGLGIANLLGQLAQGFTATSPRSPQFQIGGIISQLAQNQIFSNYLNNLMQSAIGGTQGNPNTAASSLSPFEAAALSPALQQQALGTSLGVEKQASDISAQRVNDLLNLAQAANLTDISAKRPTLKEETEAQADLIRLKDSLKDPSTNTILLNELSDGRKAPEGKAYKVSPNPKTGMFDIIQGIVDMPKRGGGGGADPAVQNRLWFNMIDRMAKTKVQEKGFGQYIVDSEGRGQFNFLNPEEGGKVYQAWFKTFLSEGAQQGLVPQQFTNFADIEPLPTTISDTDSAAIKAAKEALKGKEESGISKFFNAIFPNPRPRPERPGGERKSDAKKAKTSSLDIGDLPGLGASERRELPLLKSRDDFKKLRVGESFRLEDGRVGVKRTDQTFDIVE